MGQQIQLSFIFQQLTVLLFLSQIQQHIFTIQFNKKSGKMHKIEYLHKMNQRPTTITKNQSNIIVHQLHSNSTSGVLIESPKQNNTILQQKQQIIPHHNKFIRIKRSSLTLKQIKFTTNEELKSCKKKKNIQCKNQELKLLKQVLKRKQQVIQNEQISKKIKSNKQYEYYDLVVCDLISEIKSKKKSFINSQKRMMTPEHLISKPTNINIIKRITMQSKFSPKKSHMIFHQSQISVDKVYEKKISSMLQFLYLVNYSNNIYIDLSLSNPNKVYRVKVGAGNNSLLIKSIIKKRFWLQLSSNSQNAHLIWTQNTQKSIHESQQNIIKCIHKQNSTKINRKNNTAYPNAFKILSIKDINPAIQAYQKNNRNNLSYHVKLQVKSLTNHLPNNYIISCKRILYQLILWYYNTLKINYPQFIPKTYIITSGQCNGNTYRNFQKLEGIHPDKLWIIKPGQNTNQGHGITITCTSEVKKIIHKKQHHKNGEKKTYIIQQYLKPFLYNNRKFDIRHYLLLTSVNGYVKAYWFQQGYIRTCSNRYTTDDIKNDLVHLTNDAIQKQGQDYGKYEEGNKISYNTFQRYLNVTYPHRKYDFYKEILTQMKNITTQIVKSAKFFIDPSRKSCNFELYGMDFIIDNKFKLYLIQVNANPCLEISCPLLSRIIPLLLQHTFRLAIDPLLPPPQHYQHSKRYDLTDNILNRLKYELIYDEKFQDVELKRQFQNCKVTFNCQYVRSNLNEQIYPEKGQEQNKFKILE